VKLPVFCRSFFLAGGSPATVASTLMERKTPFSGGWALPAGPRGGAHYACHAPLMWPRRRDPRVTGNMRGPGDRRCLV
jgi:hypothetical protein